MYEEMFAPTGSVIRRNSKHQYFPKIEAFNNLADGFNMMPIDKKRLQ